MALSKDLKKSGWRFVGPTTVYAFMQAMGLVNDHFDGLPCAREGAEGPRRAQGTGIAQRHRRRDILLRDPPRILRADRVVRPGDA